MSAARVSKDLVQQIAIGDLFGAKSDAGFVTGIPEMVMRIANRQLGFVCLLGRQCQPVVIRAHLCAS